MDVTTNERAFSIQTQFLQMDFKQPHGPYRHKMAPPSLENVTSN